MRFTMITLVDITETKARFNKNDPAWHQQQNFITVIQTLGIRCNISYNKPIIKETLPLKDLQFGSSYKGQHSVWCFEFEPDFEAFIDLEMLENDFDLIPIITELEESVKLKRPMIETKDPKTRNTFFKCSD